MACNLRIFLVSSVFLATKRWIECGSGSFIMYFLSEPPAPFRGGGHYPMTIFLMVLCTARESTSCGDPRAGIHLTRPPGMLIAGGSCHLDMGLCSVYPHQYFWPAGLWMGVFTPNCPLGGRKPTRHQGNRTALLFGRQRSPWAWACAPPSLGATVFVPPGGR